MDFRVLGPFEVAGDDVVELGGPKQRTFLALLVVRANEIVASDTLVEAIWRGRPPGSPFPILRTYASRLRRALSSAAVGARLVGRAPGYLLEVDAEDVDAGRFERLAGRGRREVRAGHAEAASATLTAALGLWRGEFLADLAEMPCFRPVAARLEDLRIAAIEDRIEADLALGRHADVAGELEELTTRQPFRERLWGQRIVALYRSGRQADALAAYRAVQSTLIEELGIAPGPALQRLELDVLRQAEGLCWHPPSERRRRRPNGATKSAQANSAKAEHDGVVLPVALSEGPESRPLVGRTVELSRLDRSLQAAREGRFRAAFVAGPPGIGKTALVARCARVAHGNGAVVALGRTDEHLAIPFQALRGAIRQWLAGPGAAELSTLGDTDAALLSRLVPEILEDRTVATDPSVVDGDLDRHLLFEAITRWVTRLARHGPAVLVLEDLHWADHATLLAVRHLLRHPPAAGAIVLMTYRDTELAADGQLASLVADARRDEFVSHTDLAGLREGEVVDLLRAELGPLDDAAITFADLLNRRTGGNPLFIHETLRHLTERGALPPSAGRWPGERDLDALGVPTGVSQVLGRRLRRLPERTTLVLREASVVGQQFDVPVLSRMLGMAAVAVLDAIEPAVASSLVDPLGAPADDFAFSHSLVRDAIFETIPLADRPRAHWRAGQAIAGLHASHVEPHLEEVARHLVAGVQAGDPRTAVSASVEAGRRAMAALAFEDAADWFRIATGLVARTGPVDPELEFDAWFGLGTAASAAGRWPRHQHDGYLKASRISHAQHWPERFARSVIGLAFHSLTADEPAALRMQPDGDRPEAERLADEALALLGDTAPTERALLLGMVTVLAVRSGRSRDAHRLAGTAAAVARSTAAAGSDDDPAALGGALLARCWTLLGGSRPRDMAETAERALALPIGSEARSVIHALVLPSLVVAPLQLGDRIGFDAARARVSAHPAVRRSAHLAGYLRMLDAGMALASGRLDEAEQMAGSIASKDEWRIWHDTAAIQSTAIAVERGQFDRVVEGAGAGLALAPDAVIPRLLLAAIEARSPWARAHAHVTAERVEELGRLVRRRLRDEPPNWEASILLALTGEVAARLEAAGLARHLLPVLSGYSGQMLVSYFGTTIICAADRPMGQALLALGRPREARERLQAARDLERSFGADGLARHSGYWLARAHLACGERQAACALIGEALASAERLGMGAVAEDCRAMSRMLV